MDRFFIKPEEIKDNVASIQGEDVGHILRVLRLHAGDCICLCDGQGYDYTARISGVDKQTVYADIMERRMCETEPRHRVTLYQSLPKAGKMEVIIQKCVELGIFAIQPVYSARCVAQPDSFEKKLKRYQRVAYEAAKQSRRGIVPAVLPVTELAACAFPHELVLFAYEEERVYTLKQALRGTHACDIALIIGPEGGFAPEEALLLQQKGVRALSLGKRILRTETAGMAMLAMVMYELETGS